MDDPQWETNPDGNIDIILIILIHIVDHCIAVKKNTHPHTVRLRARCGLEMCPKASPGRNCKITSTRQAVERCWTRMPLIVLDLGQSVDHFCDIASV